MLIDWIFFFLSFQKDELIVPGSSDLQRQLAHGNIVVLKSKSAKSLRINAGGVVEGLGEEGRYGEWEGRGGEGRGGEGEGEGRE